MLPEIKTRNLITLLGWSGGTVHDACSAVGLDVDSFLAGSADFSSGKPCDSFRKGYKEAKDIAIYLSGNKGNLQYWFGAIAAVQNNYEIVDEE